MIFTAYFDETDTHGSQPTIIMAAALGHEYQWRRFGANLSRLQSEYGFQVFHTTDYKAKSGEFRGWTEEKCIALLSDLVTLMADKLAMGAVVHLEHQRYIKEYRAPPIPRKLALDSQYGVCFRACLGQILHFLESLGGHHILRVVLEGGHPNAGDCGRIFADIKQSWRQIGSVTLDNFCVRSKKDCPPLMIADILAASLSRLRANVAAGAFDPRPHILQQPRHRQMAFAVLELAPDALHSLKENFEKKRQLRAEIWRAQHAIGGPTNKPSANAKG